MKYIVRITIDRPLAEVWAYLDDPRRQPQWQQDLVQYQPYSGEPGRKASKAKLTFQEGDKKLILTEEIKERRPEEKIKTLLTHNQVRTRRELLLVDQGGRTELVVTTDTQFMALAYQLMAPFMKGSFSRRMREDLERLKELLEASRS